jgi:hypothetical protein
MHRSENMQPNVLVAATNWWPLSAKLAMSLLRHGCRVEALCPPGHPLRYVRGISRYHLYRRLSSLRSMHHALAAADPEVVIPCDDGAVWQLHQLYHDKPELRALITRSLGSAAHFEVVASREALLHLARDLGIRVPRTERVKTREDLYHWFRSGMNAGVLKQDGTWGGNGVHVARSQTEAEHVLMRMLEPIPWTTAWKRMVINHDPIALWSCARGKTPVVTVQEFMPGRPANMMIACWKGRMLGAVTVEVLQAQGATGPATAARIIQHPEMAQAACILTRRLELSGFHGLDFILEPRSGAAYLIEMNPRCTQLGHLPIAGQKDLAGLLCGELGAVSPHAPDEPPGNSLTASDTIAFFPRALQSDPQVSDLRDGYQDAPWDEPQLMEELLKEDWPDRQWQARLYHWLRPPRRNQPVRFD